MSRTLPLAITIASVLGLLPQAMGVGTETAPPSSTVGDPQGASKIVDPSVNQWLPGGSVTLAYQGSEHLNLGYIDSMSPLWRRGNAEVFLDSRTDLDDESRYSSSYGLGFRYLFPKPEVIVGVNAFYDSIHSPYGNDFNQLGLGAEVLSKWVDARFNYYLPDNNLYEVGRSTSVQNSATFGPLFLNGLLLQERVTATQKIRTISLAEGAMQGLDAEVGFLIPKLDRYMQVRIFAGAYHFDNPVGADFTGFKARIEARLLPGVTADVAYWEDAYLNGGQWTAGLRVSVPFSIGNLFTGRNPFEGFKDQFRPGLQQDFSTRMNESVLRSPARTTITGWNPGGHINGAMEGKGNVLTVKTVEETATLGKITGFQPANLTAAGTFSGGLFSVTAVNGATFSLGTSSTGSLSAGALSFSGASLSLFQASTNAGNNIPVVITRGTVANDPVGFTNNGTLTINNVGASASSLTLSNAGASTVFLSPGLNLNSGAIIAGNLSFGGGGTITNALLNQVGSISTLVLSGQTNNFVGNNISFNSFPSNGTITFTPSTVGKTIVIQGQGYTIPASGGTLIFTNGVVTGGTLANP